MKVLNHSGPEEAGSATIYLMFIEKCAENSVVPLTPKNSNKTSSLFMDQNVCVDLIAFYDFWEIFLG